MSLGQQLAPHLPFLRRYARALTGSQSEGDQYVRATLEAIVAAPEEFPREVDPRLGLYRTFQAIWASSQPEAFGAASASGDENEAIAQARLARIAPLSRQALLLTAMEGFTTDDAAYLIEASPDEVEDLVAEALREIEQQTRSRVMIIEDEPLIAYCRELQVSLARQTALGEPVRALLDLKPAKAATKRWGWVKKGAPIIIEVGGRDMAGGNVSVVRRDRLYRNDGKLDSAIVARDGFAGEVGAMLADIQATLLAQSTERLRAQIAPVDDWADVEAHFAPGVKNPGWLDVRWSKPTGAALEAVVQRLKGLKITIRNAPLGQTGCDDGPCVFTGAPAVERVLIGRAY